MKVRAAEAAVAELAADALVVTYFAGEPLGPLASSVDQALGQLLSGMIASREATGKFPERVVISTQGKLKANRVVLLALGRREVLDGYRLRNALQFVVRQLRGYCSSLAFAAEPGLVEALSTQDPTQASPSEVARAISEGVSMGNYRIGELKSVEERGEISELTVVGLGDSAEVGEGLSTGVLLGERTNRARVLQWRPSNRLTPELLAREAEAVARETGLNFEVLERADMERLGMGALLGVARGSHQPPKMVVLRHRPKHKSSSGRVLGLAGKGITFDTGGISLKANPGMLAMKADMSGAAAVIQAMALVAERECPIEVIGVAALTENMPGGGAIKPGDVLTAMNGKTIEVNNTDAEGRLVLADALCYLTDQGATHLVDVATLTGAVVVSLGHSVSAAIGTDPEFTRTVQRAGQLSGERIWELPMYPEHDVALTCDIADMANTSGTPGSGAINGAIFLREFTSQRPWVHLDIAGTAYHSDQLLLNIVPRGPSGVMTRTLARLPFELA